MILFYDKRDGKVFATTDGRVHDQASMKCFISDGTPKKDIGKYIIGWEELKETEEKEIESEEMVEIGKNLFKRKMVKTKIRVGKKREHNLDQFKLLQKFEDISKDNPMQYKVIDNKLIKN